MSKLTPANTRVFYELSEAFSWAKKWRVQHGTYVISSFSSLKHDNFTDQLMSALDESEQLLSEISSHTRRTVSTTSQYAQAINNLASSTSEQQSQINR